MHSERVALLAETRRGHLEHGVIVGAMRVVAIQTAFLDRRMLPEEGAAFFSVTFVASVVDGGVFQ